MFRFTIRDVLWLTVVAAMGASWWIDHRRQAGEIARLDRLGIELEPFFPAVGDVKPTLTAPVQSAPESPTNNPSNFGP
jgi:hypothetical protein